MASTRPSIGCALETTGCGSIWTTRLCGFCGCAIGGKHTGEAKRAQCSVALCSQAAPSVKKAVPYGRRDSPGSAGAESERGVPVNHRVRMRRLETAFAAPYPSAILTYGLPGHSFSLDEAIWAERYKP